MEHGEVEQLMGQGPPTLRSIGSTYSNLESELLFNGVAMPQ